MTQILVIQTAFLGDVILTFPLLDGLRRTFLDSEITFVCREGLGNFVKASKLADQVHEIEKGNTTTYKNLGAVFSCKKFQYLFCPHPSLRSALFAQKIFAEKKLGFKNSFSKYFADIEVNGHQSHQHQARHLYEMLLAVEPSRAEIRTLNQIFQPTAGGVKTNAVSIFLGSQWGTKRWPLEKHRKLAQELIVKNIEVQYYGSKEDSPWVNSIISTSNSSLVTNFCGRLSLIETVAAVSKTKVCLANDSGGGHLASMSGAHVISIFGPTRPEQGFTPFCDSYQIIEETNLNCRPCGAHGPQRCPLIHHQCMESISAQTALAEILRVMQNS